MDQTKQKITPKDFRREGCTNNASMKKSTGKVPEEERTETALDKEHTEKVVARKHTEKNPGERAQ